MCEVYNNAHVVIAANRSINSEGGCFHLRQPRRQALIDDLGSMGGKGIYATLLPLSEQQVLGDSAIHKIETTIFKGEPLASRGWYVCHPTSTLKSEHSLLTLRIDYLA